MQTFSKPCGPSLAISVMLNSPNQSLKKDLLISCRLASVRNFEIF